MQPFSAVVKNGRLVLDAPCDFPEGEVVILLPLNELLASAEDGEAMGDDDGDGEGLDIAPLLFEIPSARAPRFRKTAPVDAAALIKELRSI